MTTEPPVFYACFTEPAGPGSAEAIPKHFDAHKAWLKEHENDIFIAGPLLSDSLEYIGKGLIVLRAESLENAREIAATDPMHRSGARSFQVAPWRLHEGSLNVRLTVSDRSHLLT
ncbi:MAG TPA: YciI family protein [Pseudonocardia sp.]|jgi:uncharacterized protein YciI|nr:YciI family protein [Pseudonocardia sp.]